MGLIELLVIVLVVVFLLWLNNTYMPDPFKKIINIVVVVIVLIWLIYLIVPTGFVIGSGGRRI